MFIAALRATFAKAFEYARYYNRIKPTKVDEGAYFLSGALRGVCEELITLKFIHQLPPATRDEVIVIEMMRALRKATEEQERFFHAVRPFQPVVAFHPNPSRATTEKDRIDEIARTTGIWKPQSGSRKGKLPPVEYMADRVGLRAIYDYFYRISSDIVHFNPRITLRSGWGKDPRKGVFSTSNFARYYLFYGQIYSVFLFVQISRTFQQDLALSKSFLKKLDALDKQIGDILRWPEAVTYEEMNQQEPSWWLRAALKFAHEQGWDKKTTEEYLPHMAKAAKEAGILPQKK